jgi:hypothetical protein
MAHRQDRRERRESGTHLKVVRSTGERLSRRSPVGHLRLLARKKDGEEHDEEVDEERRDDSQHVSDGLDDLGTYSGLTTSLGEE